MLVVEFVDRAAEVCPSRNDAWFQYYYAFSSLSEWFGLNEAQTLTTFALVKRMLLQLGQFDCRLEVAFWGIVC